MPHGYFKSKKDTQQFSPIPLPSLETSPNLGDFVEIDFYFQKISP